MPIVGPASSVINEMIVGAGAPIAHPEALTDGAEDRRLACRSRRKAHEPSKLGEVLKPQEVIEALCRVTRGEAYVTTDVGQHQMFAAQYYKFDKPIA